MKTQARQGDVFLERIDDMSLEGLDRVPEDKGRVILAYGEVTGHAHAICSEDALLFQGPGPRPQRYLKVLRETSLSHEEHAKVLLFPGLYRVTQQREYQPGAIPRPVAD